MDYDCGALREHPRQSAIFRYINNSKHVATKYWPDNILFEACVFVNTLGISNQWLNVNLGFGHDRLTILKSLIPEAAAIGKTNHLTATYDDAIYYCQRGPEYVHMPLWAVPFFLEDIKNKIPESEIKRRWGSVRYRMRKKDFLSCSL